MPFLDVIHLCFEAAASIEDQDSIFGKEWYMTLQYVLNQPGLTVAYVSHLSTYYDMWVFLVWKNEDHRSYFYHQTTGFGFMVSHMVKPPCIIFFRDAIYTELGKTSQWTIDVVSADVELAQDLERTVSEEWLEQISQSDGFAVRQMHKDFENLYEGNGFGATVITIVKTPNHVQRDWEPKFIWNQYAIELEMCEPKSHKSSGLVEAPREVADLLRRQPWEYGVLSRSESPHSDSAYPMGLTFQPMSHIVAAAKFALSEWSQSTDPPELNNITPHVYFTAMINVRLTEGPKFEPIPTELLREMTALRDDVYGLCELNVLRVNGHDNEVCFLTVWNTINDFRTYQQKHMTDESIGSSVIESCTVAQSWMSDVIGLEKLSWEKLPLTPDKQLYQSLEKILELIEFRFANALTAPEKEAFTVRVHDFINIMSSDWSGDVDDEPVVYAEYPIWIAPVDSPSTCLLFLAWDGPEQRAAWLRNFMAHSFTWTGHIAHILGLICHSVESSTFSMEKSYKKRSEHDLSFKDNGNEDEDIEFDIGF